jgi:hypothetical protein
VIDGADAMLDEAGMAAPSQHAVQLAFAG